MWAVQAGCKNCGWAKRGEEDSVLLYLWRQLDLFLGEPFGNGWAMGGGGGGGMEITV